MKDISRICISKYQDFERDNRRIPTILNLSYEEYLELYRYCLFNWTRKLNEPLVLKSFLNCEIRLNPTVKELIKYE